MVKSKSAAPQALPDDFSDRGHNCAGRRRHCWSFVPDNSSGSRRDGRPGVRMEPWSAVRILNRSRLSPVIHRADTHHRHPVVPISWPDGMLCSA